MRATNIVAVTALLFVGAVLISSARVLGQASLSTGLLLLEPERYRSVPPHFSRSVTSLPPHFDLGDDFPAVGDQRPQQSCVAWAVGYALKSYHERVERGWPYNRDHIFSPAFLYNPLALGNCQSRFDLPTVLAAVSEHGVAPLSVFDFDPADCSKQPTDLTIQDASQYSTGDFRRVNSENPGEIKRLLFKRLPVIIGMLVGEDFLKLTAGEVYAPGTADPLSLSAHAMVVVGYNNEKQAFRILNSWGTAWADGGFGWVSYATFRERVREAYVLFDAVATPPDTLVTTVLRSEVPAGLRSAQTTVPSEAGDEANFTLELHADPGAEVRMPRLGCISSGCGRPTNLRIRVDDWGRRAVASWTAATDGGTWRLEADQVRYHELRLPTTVTPDGTFSVTIASGEPLPLVEITKDDEPPLSFEAGGLPSDLTLHEHAVDAKRTTLTYSVSIQ